MEKYFEKFRGNIIGHNQEYISPYGKKRMIYADWVASGRLYRPIEKRIINEVGPLRCQHTHRNQRNGNTDD